MGGVHQSSPARWAWLAVLVALCVARAQAQESGDAGARQTTDSDDQKNGMEVVVVAVILALLFVLAVFFYWQYRRKLREEAMETDAQGGQPFELAPLSSRGRSPSNAAREGLTYGEQQQLRQLANEYLAKDREFDETTLMAEMQRRQSNAPVPPEFAAQQRQLAEQQRYAQQQYAQQQQQYAQYMQHPGYGQAQHQHQHQHQPQPHMQHGAGGAYGQPMHGGAHGW